MSCRRPAILVCCLLAFAPAVRAQKTVYLAFGDSITAGDFDSDTSQPGYPPKLQALLVAAGMEASVENYGLGGEQTTDGVSRIDTALALANADVLLLLEGTNDIFHGVSIETTVQDLDTMANKASNKGLSTVHATIIPFKPGAKVNSDNLLTEQLNMLIRTLALQRSRQLVDPYEVFREQDNLFDTYYYSGSDDPVGHPNHDGYQLLAQTFADVLLDVDSVPPVPIGVDPADGAQNVAPGATLTVKLVDFGNDIDSGSLQLLLNGDPVNAKAFSNGAVATLQYSDPDGLLGVYKMSYAAGDLASPSNSVTRRVSTFTIAGTTFLQGDLDRDGKVDGYDLVLLGSRFGGRRGSDSLYYVGFDINGDGVLDGDDLAILANNFGKSSF